MPNIRLIKRRIRSIQSTSKITRAMEMIAASKMRRAQERGLAARPYAEKISQVLADLAAQPVEESKIHPLLARRPVKNIEVIHITADRGLCGGLNSNTNRLTLNFIHEQKVPVNLITVGRKGRDFMMRYGYNVKAEFTNLGDRPGILDILPIARCVIDDYTNGQADLVYIVYPRFVTTMNQRPVMEKLLPIEPAPVEKRHNVEYIYEPSSSFVLAQLLPRFVEREVYHAIVETIASEQSARMVAMRNATENAKEFIQDLTLNYNKARQEIITRDILEVAGSAAVTE